MTRPIDAISLQFLADEIVNEEQRVVATDRIEWFTVGFVHGSMGDMVFELEGERSTGPTGFVDMGKSFNPGNLLVFLDGVGESSLLDVSLSKGRERLIPTRGGGKKGLHFLAMTAEMAVYAAVVTVGRYRKV